MSAFLIVCAISACDIAFGWYCITCGIIMNHDSGFVVEIGHVFFFAKNPNRAHS